MDKKIFLEESVIKAFKNGLSVDSQLFPDKLSVKKLYICDHCDAFYAVNLKSFFAHVRKCKYRDTFRRIPQSHELTIACPLCPLKLKTSKILQLHLKEHANFVRLNENRLKSGQSPLLPCSRCERHFASNSELSVHLKNHEKNVFMTCELCGRTTIAANLSAHLQSHFKKFFCEYCSLICKSRHDLEKHINRKHRSPETYECAYCGVKIKRKARLEKHLMSCRGKDTILPCPHCGIKFETKNERKSHIRKEHLGFHCRICGIEFENVSRLNRHVITEQHKAKSLAKKLKKSTNT